MAISKEQPMRPAEIEMLDAMNTAQDDITALKTANTTLSEGLEEANTVIGQLHQEIGQEIETRSQADRLLTDAINEVKADVAAIPVFEYGVSADNEIAAGSNAVINIEFQEEKTSTPYVLIGVECVEAAESPVSNCYGVIVAASNAGFSIRVYNLDTANAETVTINWLAIGE